MTSATQLNRDQNYSFEHYKDDVNFQDRVTQLLALESQSNAFSTPNVRDKRKYLQKFRKMGVSRSLNASPANQLSMASPKMVLSSSCDDLVHLYSGSNTDSKMYLIGVSGHNFRRLLVPGRCQQCQSYVYFHGVSCNKCNYICHKRCLRYLKQACSSQKFTYDTSCDKIKLFECKSLNPVNNNIILQAIECCIKYIEDFGLQTKGLYRTSGVKSKVNYLYERILSGDFNLENETIHIVANTLKMLLRESKHLLVTDLVAKKMYRCIQVVNKTNEMLTSDFISILTELPALNYQILLTIIKHIKKVSLSNIFNLMTVSNLAVVFGPTLFTDRQDTLSPDVLTYNQLQCKILEYMIDNFEDIFGGIITPEASGIELSPFAEELSRLSTNSNKLLRSRPIQINEKDYEVIKTQIMKTRQLDVSASDPIRGAHNIEMDAGEENISDVPSDATDQSGQKKRKALTRTKALSVGKCPQKQ